MQMQLINTAFVGNHQFDIQDKLDYLYDIMIPIGNFMKSVEVLKA